MPGIARYWLLFHYLNELVYVVSNPAIHDVCSVCLWCALCMCGCVCVHVTYLIYYINVTIITIETL